MVPQMHMSGAIGHAVRHGHREFWLAVLVALIVLLTCTGPAGGHWT